MARRIGGWPDRFLFGLIFLLVSFPMAVQAFTITGSIQNVLESEGAITHRIYIDVTIGDDFTGALPGGITSIAVMRNGAPWQQWTPAQMTLSGRTFSKQIDNFSALGDYTFTVIAGSQTATATDSVTVNRTLPAAGQIYIEDNTTKTPILSWAAGSYSLATLYYSLEISNEAKTQRIYLSPPTANTSFTIPNVLQAGQTYYIRVLTLDGSSMAAAMNRSNGTWNLFSRPSSLQHASPPALSLDGYGVTTFTTDSGNYYDAKVCLTDMDGVSPDAQTQSHTVKMKTPTTLTEYTLVPFETVSATTVCYHYEKEGNPAYIGPVTYETGAFTFTVTDQHPQTKSLNDTLSGSLLPAPVKTSFLMTPNGTTPTFSWGTVASDAAYQVQIYSQDGSETVWIGDAGKNTSYTVPPGILAPDTPYRYRIAAARADGADSTGPFDIDHVSAAPRLLSSAESLFMTAAETVAPYIEPGDGVSTIKSPPGGVRSSSSQSNLNFKIKVHDAQGVPGNIKSVRVLFLSGQEEQLYYDDGNAGNSSVSGVYVSSPDLAPVSGTYTFIVTDRDGHTHSVAENLTVNEIGYPNLTVEPVSTQTYPKMNNVMSDTAVNFVWDTVAGAAYYRLRVYDKDYSLVLTRNMTGNSYSLPAGFLKKSSLYRYDITTYRESPGDNINNYSLTKWMETDMPTFLTGPKLTGTSSPTIATNNLGVYIDTMDNPRNPGNYLYALNFEVSVSDADGAGNIKSVTVTYPNNPDTKRELRFDRDEIKYDSVNEVYYYVYYYYYREIMALNSIPAGNYTFTVTDQDSRKATVVDSLTKNPISPPANLSPVAGSNAGTTPTISWSPVSGVARYSVDIYDGWNWRKYYFPTGDVALTETSSSVPAGYLKANSMYSYTVFAYREASGQDLDNRSLSDYRSNTERIHFYTGTAGDASGNGGLFGLEDAIVALQVMARMKPAVYKDADVNGDGKIGLPEAIYVLQAAAGLR